MDRQKDRDGKPGVNEGRRKLIKAAAVAGGAVAAAGAIPGDWKKPLATVGGLPAHAQTSDTPITIPDSSLVISTNTGDPGVLALNGVLPVYTAAFDFVDPLCEIDDTATLWTKVGPCGKIEYDDVQLKDIDLSLKTLDGCEGSIKFLFHPCDLGNGSLSLRLSKGSRHSNVVSAPFLIVNATNI